VDGIQAPAALSRNLAPILALLDNGATEGDVALGIAKVARAGRKGNTWGYHRDPIKDAQRARLAAANGTSAPTSNGHAGNGYQPDQQESDAEWEFRTNMHRQTGHWHSDWGPAPGYGGCRVPRDLLAPFLEEQRAKREADKAAWAAEHAKAVHA
jgi:hypothetical protein